MIEFFEKTISIKFVNFYEGRFFSKKKVHTGCSNYDIKTEKSSITIDIDYLKDILKLNYYEVEQFINAMMHELGHVVQTRRKSENIVNIGIQELIIDTITHKVDSNFRGTILNEFAEIINAERLQKGNIITDKYYGYNEIQNVGKVIVNSLGITETELADLQFKGRDDYESKIRSILNGVPAKLYIDAFEVIIDSIYEFSLSKKHRHNLISAIDALQVLSKELFKERLEAITYSSKNILEDLAKLSIQQGNKGSALMQIFDEFNIEPEELKIDMGTDIYTIFGNVGFDDEFLMKLHNVEDEQRIKNEKERKKQSKKVYDNSELIERMYQSFLRYPLIMVPIKDLPGVIISKLLGRIKRKNMNAKLLPVGENNSRQEHRNFASEIANFEPNIEHVPKENDGQELIEEDRGEKDNENSR